MDKKYNVDKIDETCWMIMYGNIAQMIYSAGDLICFCVKLNTIGYKASNNWTKLIQ